MIKKREMEKLADQFDSSPKNSKIKNKAQKEHFLASLEYLRISNDIVKKISEKTSNKFEDEINKLETRYNDWYNGTDELMERFYDSRSKLDEIDAKGMESFSPEEILAITGPAKKMLKEIEEKNALGKVISKDLQILSSKISIMTEGFDSLIEFLDGNRY